ncbi:MAG TPA: HD domain-containing phosphohydrolase [Nitrospirota bacterium]|nr:HD domain-containing phosphohydrolase [Nitrospirota bacterium]
MAELESHTDLVKVISQFTAAVTNTTLYSPAHPHVVQYVDKAFAALERLLADKPEITLLLIGEDLVADNRPLPGSSAYVINFARIMRRKGVERITFLPGMQKAELAALIKDVASAESVSVKSSQGIKLGKVELRVVSRETPVAGVGSSGGAEGSGTGSGTGGGVASAALSAASEDAVQELLALTEAELDALKEAYLAIKKHRRIDVRGVDDMVRGFIKGFRQEINPLSLLASLKSVHEYTFTHVTNVCILTMAQAESLGFSGSHLHSIGVSSLLHDVGKIFIPEDILNKPGVLTPEERKVIETHTVKGARYLMGIDGIPKLAIVAALEHHRKFDGSGYPSIKGGWTPNVTSQMISIADVFDAMRSSRSYQGPIPLDRIVSVLRKGAGTSFNQQFVEHFLRLIRYQPPIVAQST